MPSRTRSTTIADRRRPATGRVGNARRRRRRSARPDVNLAVIADTDTSLKVCSDAKYAGRHCRTKLDYVNPLYGAVGLCCRTHGIAHGELHRALGELLLATFAEVPLDSAVLRPLGKPPPGRFGRRWDVEIARIGGLDADDKQCSGLTAASPVISSAA